MDRTTDASPHSVVEHQPDVFLWVFNPQSGHVTLRHDYDTDPAWAVDHHDLAQVHGPHSWHGYAYPIRGGWRVFDYWHEPVEDPYILHSVTEALSELHDPIAEPPAEPEPVTTDRFHYGLPISA